MHVFLCNIHVSKYVYVLYAYVRLLHVLSTKPKPHPLKCISRFFFYNVCFQNRNIILYIKIYYILWLLLSRQGDALLVHRQGGCSVLSYLYEYFFKKTIKFKQNDTDCVSCTIHAYNILNDKVTYFLR